MPVALLLRSALRLALPSPVGLALPSPVRSPLRSPVRSPQPSPVRSPLHSALRSAPGRRTAGSLLSLALITGSLLGAAPGAWAGGCRFLAPVGGDGSSPIVTKTISPGNPLGRPNWNTDFYVTQPYRSFKLFFTADSSVKATYPVEAYLKFSDGSNLRVFQGNVAPQPGTGGGQIVPAVPGKQVSQVNIKVGSSSNLAATGFTYRVSVQGCP